MICGARTRFFHPHPFRLWLKNCFFTEWPAAFFALNHASLDVNKCHHEHSSRGQIGIPEMPGLEFWFFKIRKRSWNLTKRLNKAPHEYSQQRKASSFLWLFGSKPSILVILYHMKIHCPVFFGVFQGFDPRPYLLLGDFKWRPNNWTHWLLQIWASHWTFHTVNPYLRRLFRSDCSAELSEKMSEIWWYPLVNSG